MLAAERRQFKQQHYWKRPEYWEESWRLEETCCHSISSERPSANADVKTLTNNNNNNNNSCQLGCARWPQNKTEKMWKEGKYLDLARELKKLWNMQVTIIPIVIGAFGTVTKGLLKVLEDLEVGRRVETIQTTTLLKTARIPRRVLETWGDLLSLKLQWDTNSERWCDQL